MTVENVDDPPITPPPTVNVALWYASIGLRVFPLQPGLKLPYRGTSGFKDATTNPDIITDWWQIFYGANLGIASHGNPFHGVAGPPYLEEGEMAVIKAIGADFDVVARVRPGAWPTIVSAAQGK